MIKRENYINIQGFMVTDLGLKGNELLIYAIIYGFSQEESSKYSGSLQYLADWTNTSKQTVINCLNGLIEKDLIEKNEVFKNNVKFCEYHSKIFNTPIQNFLIPPIQKTLMNNKDNLKTKEDNKYISEFDEFWSAYTPVKCNGRFIDKGSKKTAYDKFCKILDKGVNYEDIITGVRKYIKHCQENGQLTCGVAVFLNQERWKCDYGEVVNGNARAEYRQPDSILEEYAKIASRY